jgi:hypothetical protein
MTHSEKQIEKYLVDQVRIKLKGTAYKFTSPGRRAVPDRICVIPGYCFFVECKATGKYLTDAQEREQDRLQELDQWVYMANSKFGIDHIVKCWKRRLEEECRI